MENETQQSGGQRLAAPPCSAILVDEIARWPSGQLAWTPGPANGGGGNADSRDGLAYWYDSTLLVIVERNCGREIIAVYVSDGEMWHQGTGDDTGWTLDDVAWWADLDNALPPLPNTKVSDDADQKD